MSDGAARGVRTASREEERFVRERVDRWKELQDVLAAARKQGLRGLGGERVSRLGALYRSATTDLALAQTLGVSEATRGHLNRLCTIAHNLLYAGRRRSPAGRVAGFLTGGFPRLVRRTWKFHAVAIAVFVLTAVATFAAFRDDPALAQSTLGPDLYVRAYRGHALQGSERQYLEIPSLTRPLFSWGIIANNLNATITLFALGATFGLGTLLGLVANGVNVGGVVAIYHEVGAPDLIWTWMACHGPIELMAVFIAAGGGLRMGLGMLLPGPRTRGDAFKLAALDSVRLLGGTCAMLLIAGLLEGFASPAVFLPPAAKWTIAVVTSVLMALYFGLAGRGDPPPAATA